MDRQPIAYLIGAGDCTALHFQRLPGDLVIAADGGLDYLREVGIEPDVILGDFDSHKGARPEGNVLTYPSEQDGGLGGKRLDHTLANLQMLVWAAHRNIHARLLGKDTVVSAISDGQISFPASAKGYLSVFAVGGQAEGVDLTGLKYELSNHILTDEFPLGVSNEFIGRESTVRVRKGTLILVEVR